MKQEKKQPGRLKMLAGYYKPYKGLFFADLFFAFLGAAVTLVIPLMVRYIMNSISEMSADEAKTMFMIIRRSASFFPGSQVIFLILQSFSTMDRRIF